jgi:prepilin-type N-terminal cleavage/methylation domain-containing protein
MKMPKFTAIEMMIVIAVLAIIAAIIVPSCLKATNKLDHQPTWHINYDGWTWVGQTHGGDDIYMKHMPEQHITVYSTWRGMSVVKD